MDRASLEPKTPRRGFILALVLITGAGIFLRFHLLGLQVLGGDEWNSIRYAVTKGFAHIFTHYHVADNSIPQTAFYKALLETVGLSELGIRSLQMTAGLVLLFLFPFLVRKVFSRRVTILFSLLVAVSPFLIFYSRFARPYIVVVLLSFTAILCFHLWVTLKRRRYLTVYIACAVIAPYFNVFSIAAVAAPVVFAFFATFRGLRVGLPRRRHLVLTGLVVTAGIAAWFIPILPSLGSVTDKVSEGTIESYTFTGALWFYCGTGSLSLRLVFTALFLLGLAVAFQKNRYLCLTLVFTMTCQIAAVLLLRPHAAQFGAVFSRYSISAVPIFLLFTALALDRGATYLFKKTGKRWYVYPIFPLLFVAACFIRGPFMETDWYPNSFIHHNDYQYNYGRETMTLEDEQIATFPAFYTELKERGKEIVVAETPFLPMWRITLFHLYQKYHRKRVVIGHTAATFIAQVKPLTHEAIRLENFVNIQDPAAVKDRGVDYIIVHNDVLNEMRTVRQTYPVYHPYLDLLEDRLNKVNVFWNKAVRDQALESMRSLNLVYGDPVFEDRWISVYRVR